MKIEKVNNFWVPSNDVHLEQWKAGEPFTQKKCLEKFIAYCEKNKLKFNHIIDVGAWVGTWSMAMNQYCGRVIAFEPDETHYACLVKNVDEDIETHQLAVGHENKMIALSSDNFTQAKRVIGEGHIPMTSIDELGLDDIDVIKIDVEGYEMEVLKGAENVLKTQCKYVMIELNSNTGKYGSSNKECMDFLTSLGYKLLLEHWPDKVFYRAN